MTLIRVFFSLSIFICFSCNIFCADDSGSKKSKLKTVLVILQNAESKENEYLDLNKNSTTNVTMINVKKPFKMEYDVYFFTKEDEKPLYTSKVCDLLKEDRDKSKVPDRFFLREMMELIFNEQESCNFKNGTMGIPGDGKLPFDPTKQPGVTFPEKKKYDMIISIVDEKGKADPKKNYIMKAAWLLGVSDEEYKLAKEDN